MAKLLKLEKIIFYFFVFGFFWQLRIIWRPLGEALGEWGIISLYATDLLAGAILFLWLFRLLRQREKVAVGPVEISLGALIVLAGLAAAFSQEKILAAYGFLKILEMAALFLYFKANFRRLYRLDYFWHFFVAGAALQSGVAVWQFFAQRSLGLKLFAESPLAIDLSGVAKIVVGGEKIIRAYGLVPHPNILAAILVAALFGLAAIIIKKSHQLNIWQKSGLGSVFIFLGLALFLTFSRVAIVAGGAAFVFWLIWLWQSKNNRAGVYQLIIFMAIGVVFLATMLWPYFDARFFDKNLVDSQAVTLRSFYNETAYSVIKQDALVGVGPKNFVLNFRQNCFGLASWVWQPVHNIYLLMAAEIGILGLAAFLVFIFFAIKSVWAGRHDSAISGLLFLTGFLLVIGFFDHFLWDLQQGQFLFWLVFGLICAHSSMDRSPASEAGN